MTKWVRTFIALGFMLVSPYIGLAILSNSFTEIDPEYMLEACRGISSTGVCTMEEATVYFPTVALMLYLGLACLTLGLLGYSMLRAHIPERAKATQKMFWDGRSLLWKIIRVVLVLAYIWVVYVNYFM